MIKKTLDKAKKGSHITILELPAGDVRMQLIRLGISAGDKIFCLARLPGGTMVIQKNRQEIAIGHDLARKIIIDTEIQ